MYTPTATQDIIGQMVGSYRLTRLIGKGGMSRVFLGQDTDAPPSVALKILVAPTDSPLEERCLLEARFLREVHTLLQLRHEHILPVLAYGQEHDLLYMVMPYISGGTVANRLTAHGGPLPFAEITAILAQTADALDYAHQEGVLHRDIKPNNMLLDEQGNVYLTDFGIAHLVETELQSVSQRPTTLTVDGEVLGTPAYMAPERFLDGPVGPTTDIYALGVVLYLLVTGHVPFRGANALATAMLHIHETPQPPRLFRPELPQPAEVALLQALAKDPNARFTSAGALARAFEEGLRGTWADGLISPSALHKPLSEKAENDGLLLPVAPDVLVPAEEERPESHTTQAVQRKPKVPARQHPPRVVSGRVSQYARAVLFGLILIGIIFLALLLNGEQGSRAGHTSLSSTNTTTSSTTPSATTRPQSRTAPSVQVKGNTVSGPRTANGKNSWQVSTNGQVSQPPVIQNGIVYITTNTGYIYALRLETGQILWVTSLGSPVTSLSVSKDVVTVHTANGMVYRLQASTGKVLSQDRVGSTTGTSSPGTGATSVPTYGAAPTATPYPTQGVTPTATPYPTQGVTPTATPEETETPEE